MKKGENGRVVVKGRKRTSNNIIRNKMQKQKTSIYKNETLAKGKKKRVGGSSPK